MAQTPEQKRVWYKANAEKVKEKRRQYYKKHRNKVLRKQRIRQRANRHEMLVYNRSLKGRFTKLRGHRKGRGLSCTLTFEEYCGLVDGKVCNYCDGPLEPSGTGLDRINPNRGYELGNVQPCCKRCNVAKNNMPEVEFRAWVTKVYNKFGS